MLTKVFLCLDLTGDGRVISRGFLCQCVIGHRNDVFVLPRAHMM